MSQDSTRDTLDDLIFDLLYPDDRRSHGPWVHGAMDEWREKCYRLMWSLLANQTIIVPRTAVLSDLDAGGPTPAGVQHMATNLIQIGIVLFTDYTPPLPPASD